MKIRLLIATPDVESLELLTSLFHQAQALTCFEVHMASVSSVEAMLARVDRHEDDVVLLDWPMADAGTPDLVQEILKHNRQMRVVALMPIGYRQYRQQLWNAGACNSIPKEHMDQEWLSSILCVMHRAMEQEARLRAEYEGREVGVDGAGCKLAQPSVI